MTEGEVRGLCLKSREIFLSQPILLELEAPLKICGKKNKTPLAIQIFISLLGDIHGQYTDLLRLFEYGGFPPESNYLFLGDYVDRGKQSLETICLLLAYKVRHQKIETISDVFFRRSNIRKISFFSVEIMNALQSIEFMDFMMNANVDIISNYGKHLPIALIVYLLRLSLTKKSSVVMEV